MAVIIGTKIGMVSLFNSETRKSLACTVVQAGPCNVTQIKTSSSKDGYDAVQIGFQPVKEKHLNKADLGRFKKSGLQPLRHLKEFEVNPSDYSVGQEISASNFAVGEKIWIIGQSKGKGFQGVVKRHGFAGVGGQTHGQHNRLRHPGSIGACSFPSRVFKGMRMAGRMGNDQIKLKGLKIVSISPEDNLLVVSGPIPGSKGSIVYIESAK